jgi:putative transposase
MARLARVVLPGIPYHVTQRGNRHQRTHVADYPRQFPHSKPQ